VGGSPCILDRSVYVDVLHWHVVKMSVYLTSTARRVSRSGPSVSYARRFSTSGVLAKELQFPLTDDAFAELRMNMLARRLPVLYEAPISTPTAQFETTIKDFLPEPFQTPHGGRRWAREGLPLQPVPFSYSLIYFPPQTRLSELCADSTDPDHSPGDPFDRRMWAGGSLQSLCYPHTHPDDSSVFTSGRLRGRTQRELSACVESISDVQLKGNGDTQKIFVTLERRVGAVPADHINESEDATRDYLSDDRNVAIIEKRDLVFLNNSKIPKPGPKPSSPPRILKASSAPDHSASLVPTASLLFRYSALTFNAHRIHLDREYCRDVEGHRNLLFHGPLSCMLMCENLRGYLERRQPAILGNDAEEIFSASPPAEFINGLDYRNLAPIYADEEMRVCLRQKGESETGSTYEVWVENAQGSMCVKGTARTTRYSSIR